MPAWIEDDERWLLAGGETWPDLCRQAVDAVVAEYGEQPWGEIHHLSPLRLGERERLDLGPVAGGADCVMATNDITGAGINALTGSTCRYVWNLGDRRRSGWVVPMGADEDDGAPHQLDQVDRFTAAELFPVWP